MTLIRLATYNDIERLADLLGQLFSIEKEFSPDRTTQIRGLVLLLERGDWVRVLVAENGGRLLGMGALHYSISTYLGAKVAMLEDVVVADAHRGSGVGKQLMAGIIEQARRDGAHRVTLLTDHDNRAAQGFYESFGFSRSAMVPYRLMLNPKLTV